MLSSVEERERPFDKANRLFNEYHNKIVDILEECSRSETEVFMEQVLMLMYSDNKNLLVKESAKLGMLDENVVLSGTEKRYLLKILMKAFSGFYPERNFSDFIKSI